MIRVAGKRHPSCPDHCRDEDLAVRLESDPEMMRHIGGPRPEADGRAARKRRLVLMEKGAAHMFKIVSAGAGEVLGTVGAW